MQYGLNVYAIYIQCISLKSYTHAFDSQPEFFSCVVEIFYDFVEILARHQAVNWVRSCVVDAGCMLSGIVNSHSKQTGTRSHSHMPRDNFDITLSDHKRKIPINDFLECVVNEI